MAKLSNSPPETTVLELEARKAFAFRVDLTDPRGEPLDLTGSVLAFTLGLHGERGKGPEVLLVAHAQEQVFRLQAAELDLDPGTYQFAITLRSNGYSLVVVKGEVKIWPNVEAASTLHEYAGGDPTQGLHVVLANRNVISVTARGGAYGVGEGLDATGVEAGRLPTALGDGTWEWVQPELDFVHDVAFEDTEEMAWGVAGDKEAGLVVTALPTAALARTQQMLDADAGVAAAAEQYAQDMLAAAKDYADEGYGEAVQAAQQYTDDELVLVRAEDIAASRIAGPFPENVVIEKNTPRLHLRGVGAGSVYKLSEDGATTQGALSITEDDSIYLYAGGANTSTAGIFRVHGDGRLLMSAAGSSATRPVPWAMAAGVASAVSTVAVAAQVTVTYPVGRFTDPPVTLPVVVTGVGGSSRWVPRVLSNSTSGCIVYVYQGDGTNLTAGLTVAIRWMAVQMTPTSAVG